MIKTSQNCSDCKNDKFPSSSTSIGQPVRSELQIGRGMDYTDYSFYQCNECGSIWVHVEDSGVGGHGNYYKKLF